MLIVSVPDRLVRDPATRRVVDDIGIDIDPTDPHWARLLADGDVADPEDPRWADMLEQRAAAKAALESSEADEAAELADRAEADPVTIAAETASRRAPGKEA